MRPPAPAATTGEAPAGRLLIAWPRMHAPHARARMAPAGRPGAPPARSSARPRRQPPRPWLGRWGIWAGAPAGIHHPGGRVAPAGRRNHPNPPGGQPAPAAQPAGQPLLQAMHAAGAACTSSLRPLPAPRGRGRASPSQIPRRLQDLTRRCRPPPPPESCAPRRYVTEKDLEFFKYHAVQDGPCEGASEWEEMMHKVRRPARAIPLLAAPNTATAPTQQAGPLPPHPTPPRPARPPAPPAGHPGDHPLHRLAPRAAQRAHRVQVAHHCARRRRKGVHGHVPGRLLPPQLGERPGPRTACCHVSTRAGLNQR